MKHQPDQMTEEELLQACALRPWEQRWATSDSFRWFMPGALLLVSVPLLRPMSWSAYLLLWVVYLLFWWLPALALIPLLQSAVGLRFRAHRRELERRYGRVPFSRRVEEARLSLQMAAGPDRVVLFRGAAHRYNAALACLRVELYDEPGRPLCLPLHPPRDGFPCKLAVLRKAPFAVMEASCNLAGGTEEERKRPLIRLMARMCELALDIGSRPLPVGACDAYGNIQVGPL